MGSKQQIAGLARRVINYNGVAKYHGAFHPVTGKKPPTLEEFDPLNPGEWQMGVGGKILPRLPEGTRCGELVMGKYGLYDPRQRPYQEKFYKLHEEGVSTDDFFPRMKRITNVMVVIAIIGILHNTLQLVLGRNHLIWPNTYFAERKKKKYHKEESDT